MRRLLASALMFIGLAGCPEAAMARPMKPVIIVEMGFANCGWVVTMTTWQQLEAMVAVFNRTITDEEFIAIMVAEGIGTAEMAIRFLETCRP